MIEDWWWAHAAMPIWLDEAPLTVLIFELLLASAYEPDIVASVTASRDWAQRGPRAGDARRGLRPISVLRRPWARFAP